jgi:tRNA threonylcarbamoyladenosine biosynthesis protein TsaE
MNHKRVSQQQLEDLAAQFVLTLKPGDVVYMEGDLGVGKTTFVRAAIQALLGNDEPVASPTFTILQWYDADPPIWHYDLYRIMDPDELLELGMDEAFSNGITFIEWPQRMGQMGRRPYYTVKIELASTQEERLLMIQQHI